MQLKLIVIRTSDMQVLAEFYTLLGFSPVHHQHGQSPYHYSIQLSETVLEIYPLAKDQRAVDTYLRLGFELDEFDTVITALKEKGLRFISEPAQTEFGFMAVVVDPDGRKLSYTKTLNMSLDSVELLVSFENYFEVSIPDKEAETIYTVQNLCDSVCRHLGITASHTTLRDDVLAILKKALQKTGLIHEEIDLKDVVKEFFPYTPQTWKLLEQETGLIIPEWPPLLKDGFIEKLFSIVHWKSTANFNTLNFGDLCNVICAANYDKLLNGKKPDSSYEVYIAVMAITANKTGVYLYDIKPDKSFTDDFGID